MSRDPACPDISQVERRAISPAEFSAKFRELSESFAEFVKVETLSFYDESGDPAFDFLLDDNLDSAIRLFQSEATKPANLHITAARSGARMRRLRFLSGSPSSYEIWELYSYLVSVLWGEHIRVDQSDDGRSEWRDFVMFDTSHLYVHDYSRDGKLNQVWEVVDERFCADTFRRFDLAFSNASDFSTLVVNGGEPSLSRFFGLK